MKERPLFGVREPPVGVHEDSRREHLGEQSFLCER